MQHASLRQLQPAGRAAAASRRRCLAALVGGAALMAPTAAGAAAARPAPPRATVSDTVDADDYNRQWIELWDAGLQPGGAHGLYMGMYFDIGGSAPALKHLLDSKALGPMEGKVWLVPGCGRGYDALTAARAGASAVGLDLSETAVRDAERHRDSTSGPQVAKRARFVAGDFFTYQDPSGPFDFGYDYTFLCALHPTMREDWAAAWARQLRPGGTLVTMVYPVDPARDANTGPPWAVTPQLYTDLLVPAGFECVSLEAIPPGRSHPKRVGREWLGRWRRL